MMLGSYKKGAYALLLFSLLYFVGCGNGDKELYRKKQRFFYTGGVPSVTAGIESRLQEGYEVGRSVKEQFELNQLVADIRKLQASDGKEKSLLNLEDKADWKLVRNKLLEAIALTNVLKDAGFKAGQINELNIDALLEQAFIGDRIYIKDCFDILITGQEFWTQYSMGRKPKDYDSAPKTPKGSYGRVDFVYRDGTAGRLYLRGIDTKIEKFCSKYR
ncbi:hypothetical protein HZB88_00595 [archaeon]|nr:hypothetical protein [archaeon]